MDETSKGSKGKVILFAVFVLIIIGVIAVYFVLIKPKENQPQVIFNDDVLQLGMSQDPNDLLKEWNAESIECCRYVNASGVESTVVTTPGEYTVYFTAVNKGYVTEFKKKVNFIDDVPPVFENVNEEVDVEYATEFDPLSQVKAIDNVDGEVPVSMTQLDTSTTQHIIVEYTAIDAAGNEAKASTTYNVIAPVCALNTTFNWDQGVCE